MANLYKRSIIDTLQTFISSKEVIVLHGARQVGKTSIMTYLLEELKSKGEQVFYFDLHCLFFSDSHTVRENPVYRCQFYSHWDEAVHVGTPVKGHWQFPGAENRAVRPEYSVPAILDCQ